MVVYKILVFFNLIIMGLDIGNLMAVAGAMVPLFLQLSTKDWVKTHIILDRYIDRYMPILTATVFLTAAGELIVNHQHFWQSAFIVIGLVGTAGLALISETVNVPINHKIAAWTFESPEEVLLKMRVKWIRFHWLRSTSALIAFSALIISVLLNF